MLCFGLDMHNLDKNCKTVFSLSETYCIASYSTYERFQSLKRNRKTFLLWSLMNLIPYALIIFFIVSCLDLPGSFKT